MAYEVKGGSYFFIAKMNKVMIQNLYYVLQNALLLNLAFW